MSMTSPCLLQGKIDTMLRNWQTFSNLAGIASFTTISLELTPESSKETAFLSSLRNSLSGGFGRNTFAFALREDATWVSPQKVVQTTSSSQTVWKVVLNEDSRGRGLGTWDQNEVEFNNISSDQIAEMRARRILLNEKLGGINQTGPLGFSNDPMLESFIEGRMSSSLQVSKSPIPDLYQSFGQTPERFPKLARLASVLYLKLSNTVEDIFELDLELLNPRQLQVNFKGRRRQRYTNAEPPIIQVSGICPLE